MKYIPILSILFILSSCIGDDIIFDTVEERITFSQTVSSLQLGESFQLEARFFDNIGMEQSISFTWVSTDTSILKVDENGLITAVALGVATIGVAAEPTLGRVVSETMLIEVTENETIVESNDRGGQLQTTSSYVLEGSFSLIEENGQLLLQLEDDYKASSSLPGLYVYLTNNPSTINNAVEISKVTIFEGAHAYELPSDVALDSYNYVLYFCKPFSVKVGDGEIE